ncbi:MAG: HD domain-containing phosphohydrolase [Nitrospiria bacterium]
MAEKRILVVDDDEGILDLARMFLGSEGFHVETTSQGKDAVKRLEESEFDILLTDIIMPGMSGLELMKSAKALRPDLIMVVITGHGTTSTAIESLKVEAMGFILKPFTRQEMISAVHNSLEKYNLLQENMRLKSLMPLFQISQTLMRQTDLDALLNLIVELVKKEMRADRVSLVLLDEGGRELSIKATTGFDVWDKSRQKVPVGKGIAGMAVIRKAPILIQGGIEQNPDLKDLLADEKIASSLAFPIIVRQKVIGVMNLSKLSTGNPLRESDVGLISIICGQAGAAIENARLYRDIRTSYLRTLQALVSAIEIKDTYSKGHSKKVAHYAILIGMALRLSEDEIQDLILAGILHDIGKIGIRDDILAKAGKLSESEYEQMKSHSVDAVKILEPIGLSRRILLAIKHHHEWWDGTGYPGGLSGEEIPLHARIISIADSVSAMTSPRPYKETIPLSEATEEIKRCKGSHFDPALVDIFLQLDEKTLEDQAVTELMNLPINRKV